MEPRSPWLLAAEQAEGRPAVGRPAEWSLALSTCRQMGPACRLPSGKGVLGRLVGGALRQPMFRGLAVPSQDLGLSGQQGAMDPQTTSLDLEAVEVESPHHLMGPQARKVEALVAAPDKECSPFCRRSMLTFRGQPSLLVEADQAARTTGVLRSRAGEEERAECS